MKYLKNGKIVVNNSEELRDIVRKKEIPLELIDIKKSGLTDLDSVFYQINEINGSIENWDVSNINYMSYTFSKSLLNCDLSNWDVSNVRRMYAVFSASTFNNDSLKNWDLINCQNFEFVFYESEFNGDISNWKLNQDMFLSFYSFVDENENFKNKYNSGKDIPHDSNGFRKWFEENREKMRELNTSKEEVLDFFSFDEKIKEIV